MTTVRYDGDDTINHYTFYPDSRDDELIAKFFGGRDELVSSQGFLDVDMGDENDNFRGYATGGEVHLGKGDDNGAGAVIPSSSEIFAIYGEDGDDALEVFVDQTNQGAQVRLYGGIGVDLFSSSPNADRLDGGAGFDFIGQVSSFSGGVYKNFVTSDTIVSVEGQNGSAGNDLITPWGTDQLTVSGIFAQVGITKVVNILQGGNGADTLQGAGASDILIGNGFAQFLEGMSNYRGGGFSGDPFSSRLADDRAADTLMGGEGNDFLDGGDGADTLNGGGGTDTASYVSFQGNDNSGVSVNLKTGANTDGDTLIAIENVVGSDYRGYSGSGNDTVSGNGAVNILAGRSGADTLNGQGGRDKLYGGTENDTLIDTDGGDTLYGEGGDDIYRVGAAGTAVVEVLGQGRDAVESSVSFTLGANVELLTLTGNGAIAGTGNADGNTLTGNGAANRLEGKGGDDILIGGRGNDTYVVETSADDVQELAGQGTDTVETGIAYALRSDVENLTLTGKANVSGTGNELANVLTGNLGKNLLSGLGGNDTYVIDTVGDRAEEFSGNGTKDLVLASVTYSLSGQDIENLTLTGKGAINGTGNELANILTGNDAANDLDGNLGKDTLFGGDGKDSFIFRTALSAANLDKITDFKPVEDTIELENGIFKALTKTGTLSSAAFKDITDGARLDADDRILYNHKSGALFYDADGSGSVKAVQFATLTTSPDDVTYKDFLVV